MAFHVSLPLSQFSVGTGLILGYFKNYAWNYDNQSDFVFAELR